MSHAQIEQFASRVSNDPALFSKLLVDIQTPDDFIDKAVALGKEAGFTFSRDEADGWIKQQIEAKASGELSDLQLEGVAGGKGPAAENARNMLDQSVKNGLPISTVRWLWAFTCHSIAGA